MKTYIKKYFLLISVFLSCSYAVASGIELDSRKLKSEVSFYIQEARKFAVEENDNDSIHFLDKLEIVLKSTRFRVYKTCNPFDVSTIAMSSIKHQVKDVFQLEPGVRIHPVVDLYPHFFSYKGLPLVRAGVILHETIHGMGLHNEQATDFLANKILQKAGYFRPFDVTSDQALVSTQELVQIYSAEGCPLDEKHQVSQWIEMYSKPGPHYFGGYNYSNSSEYQGDGGGTFFLYESANKQVQSTLSVKKFTDSNSHSFFKFNY